MLFASFFGISFVYPNVTKLYRHIKSAIILFADFTILIASKSGNSIPS